MHRRLPALTCFLFVITTLVCGQNAPAPAPAPAAPAAQPSIVPVQPAAAPVPPISIVQAQPTAPAPAATPAAPAADGTTPAVPPDGARPPGAPGGGFPAGPGGRGGFSGRRGGGFGGEGGGMTGAAPGEGETYTIAGDQVMMQFATNPVADILAIYEKLTGLTLVKDSSIFEGAQISLITPKPVPKDEAIKLIEASLLTNGYAIVTEPGGKSAKILPTRNQSATAVQFSHGVRFYTSPRDIPDNESIVSYFMKLDYLTPEDAATMFSGHVGLGAYGRITAVTTPPGLLITESATVVKQLISIRESIDVGDTGSSLVTKFIPIKYGDAATIAQIIQATLTAQAQEKETKGVNTIRGAPGSDGRGNNNDNNQQRAPQQPSGNNSSQNTQAPQPSAQVVADTRLNQILVVAAPADYTYVASLIAEFDKPLEVAEPFERKLKYAAALDVLSAVVDLLQEVNSGTTQLPGGGTVQQQRQQALASNSSQLLGGRSTTGTRGGTVGSTAAAATSDTATTGTSTSGIGSRADVISGPTENNAPVSVLVGKTRVVADPMSNSILVMGRKEDIDKTNGLLDKLDRKPAQVYLATVIGQLTLTDGMKSGVDYISGLSKPGDGTNFSASGFTNRTDVLTGNAVTRAVADLRNNAITTPFGPGSGLNLYGAIGDSLEVFVTALETNNNFKILSRPSIFALNNKKAVITSGRQIPVPSQQTTFANGNNQGSTQTNIEYRDVVLKLEIVPLINMDGEVTLTISQVNDTVVGTQLVVPNEVPIIGTEQLVTTVTIPDRNTIVLGGLISEENTKNKQGLPILGRIPGLGKLFRTDTDSKTRKELIVFIQPQVVTDNLSVRQTSYSEDLRSTIGAEAAQRFPQQVPPPGTAPLVPEKKKNFFQRLFSRDKD
ncbi:MAG: type II secretion system protein GspD [Prosthecobacter sp.]|uniref:type II secretion system protein GspD n=1 Tax=Prosthecobacter sp. TaxID=1965333 RepID=UPI0038FE4D39